MDDPFITQSVVFTLNSGGVVWLVTASLVVLVLKLQTPVQLAMLKEDIKLSSITVQDAHNPRSQERTSGMR